MISGFVVKIHCGLSSTPEGTGRTAANKKACLAAGPPYLNLIAVDIYFFAVAALASGRVGTIPINIDTENSDLDIICCYTDKQAFSTALLDDFQYEEGFALWERPAQDTAAVVARFRVEGFVVEVFGQGIPSRQQMAYRHLLIEHRLLMERGEDFRRQVIALKRQGLKTEPAFAVLLGLKGDPYTELLNYEESR